MFTTKNRGYSSKLHSRYYYYADAISKRAMNRLLWEMMLIINNFFWNQKINKRINDKWSIFFRIQMSRVLIKKNKKPTLALIIVLEQPQEN